MAVAAEHELTIHDVVLIRTGTIPKTTSGKIRRSLTRELWQNNELEAYGEADVAGHRLVKQLPAAAIRDGVAAEPDAARVAGS